LLTMVVLLEAVPGACKRWGGFVHGGLIASRERPRWRGGIRCASLGGRRQHRSQCAAELLERGLVFDREWCAHDAAEAGAGATVFGSSACFSNQRAC